MLSSTAKAIRQSRRGHFFREQIEAIRLCSHSKGHLNPIFLSTVLLRTFLRKVSSSSCGGTSTKEKLIKSSPVGYIILAQAWTSGRFPRVRQEVASGRILCKLGLKHYTFQCASRQFQPLIAFGCRPSILPQSGHVLESNRTQKYAGEAAICSWTTTVRFRRAVSSHTQR